AGSRFGITVPGFGAQGQPVTGYTRTVSFASSDPYPGLLPADYTFTQADNGTHTFPGVSLFTAGPQTLTVQDTTHSSSMGSATINVLASAANHLLILAPPAAIAGAFLSVTVTAVDPYGNANTAYTRLFPK